MTGVWVLIFSSHLINKLFSKRIFSIFIYVVANAIPLLLIPILYLFVPIYSGKFLDKEVVNCWVLSGFSQSVSSTHSNY